MTIYRACFSRTDNNPAFQTWMDNMVPNPYMVAPELKEAATKAYDAYMQQKPEEFFHSKNDFLFAISNACTQIQTANTVNYTVPDWITVDIETIPNTQATTIRVEQKSVYMGDGETNVWDQVVCWNGAESFVHHAMGNVRDRLDFEFDYKKGYVKDIVVLDAPTDVLLKYNAHLKLIQEQKQAADQQRYLAEKVMNYMSSFENNGDLVVAKADYKPRGEGKQGFSKGMLAIKFWRGTSTNRNWTTSSIGVKFKNTSSRDRNDNSTTFAAENKFTAYIPSVEILHDSTDDSFTVDQDYGFIGKYLAIYLFNRLYDVGTDRDGRIQNRDGFDPMMTNVMNMVKTKYPKLIADSKYGFLNGSIHNYREFSKQIIASNQSLFDDILSHAKGLI